jgi:hypothetical protein
VTPESLRFASKLLASQFTLHAAVSASHCWCVRESHCCGSSKSSCAMIIIISFIIYPSSIKFEPKFFTFEDLKVQKGKETLTQDEETGKIDGRVY